LVRIPQPRCPVRPVGKPVGLTHANYDWEMLIG
jgi:hypothetical protein